MSYEHLKPRHTCGLPIENPNLLGVRREEILAVLDGYRKMFVVDGGPFTLRTRDEIELLIPDVYDLAGEFLEGLRPYMGRTNSWTFARSEAIKKAREKATSENRHGVWYSARDIALEEVKDVILKAAADYTPWVKKLRERYCVREMARTIAWDAVNEATWAVVGDKPGFEKNPFSSIRALHGLGAVQILFCFVQKPGTNESEALVIHFHLKPSHDGPPRLACLTVRGIQPRDKIDLIDHPLTGPCVRAIP